jgi:hypothetical protein
LLRLIQTRLADFSEYRTDAEKEFTTVSCLKTLLSEVRHVHWGLFAAPAGSLRGF